MYPEFSDKEWNEIIEAAFSPDAPEPSFSESYRKRRLAMEKEYIMEKKHSVKKSTIKMLAIVAAAAVITPTAVIAGVKMYEARMEQPNTYQRTVEIDPGDEVSEEIMALNIGWLPEDISYQEDGPYGGKYHTIDLEADRGMTTDFVKIPEGVTMTAKTFGITNEESFTTAAGYQAFFSGSEQDGVIERGDLWIAFNGTRYAAWLFVHGMSVEEMHQIADNVTLVPSDVETAGEWTPPEVDMEEERLSVDFNAPAKSVGNESDINLIEMGVVNNILHPGYEGYENITFCVNSVTVQDNFDGITTDGIGRDKDYTPYLDENGKITTLRRHVLRGNGVTTMDEVVSEETIQQYVVKVNMTYTNTSDNVTEINIFDILLQMDGSDMMHFGRDADNLWVEHAATKDLMTESSHFSFYTDHENDKNNIANVAPGESVDVETAFLVDEDWFGNLYMAFGWTFGDDSGAPILNLSDLKPE